MATYNEHLMTNEAFLENLSAPGMEKQAIDLVNDFTRTRMREEGFFRQMMPPVPISNDQLDRQLDTDLPTKIVDKEPDSPAAVSIPFNTLTSGVYIRGPKYRVNFNRIISPRFTKDIDELRTYVMDIRQILSDNAIKDMLAEEDGKWLLGFNSALIGVNTPVPWSGVPQWVSISGGVTRETVLDALKVQPSTLASLEVDHILVNNIMIKEIMKFHRDEMGGDFAQDILKDGWSEDRFLGKKWTVTIKRQLVGDSTFYMMADPKFVGKFFVLEDTVMYVRKDAYMIEFMAYESIGSTIGHSGGVSRVDFT